tara:strand:+ start:987 stop:2438 length:1452 start_codon:yes stop_codon:yes gene_type:complete
VHDAIVIGGGASGLACAHALDREGVDVVCLEAGSQAGGVIQTAREGEFLFEDGPNTIQASARTFRTVCGELGIADRLRLSSPSAAQRWLYLNGTLRALPTGLRSLLTNPILSKRARLRILTEPLRRFRRVGGDIEEPTLGEFLESRLGHEAARNIGGAFVRGVYAAELDELGARSAFPRLWDACNEHGGLIRGMLATARARKQAPPAPGPIGTKDQLLSFDDGLGELIHGFEDRLGARIRRNAPVVELSRGPGGFQVTLESGETLSSPSVVMAVPAREAHPLLSLASPDRTNLDPLFRVAHASVVVVHLGLDLAELPAGFGFLVPPTESGVAGAPKLLGALFGSQIFSGRAPDRGATVSCIYRAADVAQHDDTGLLEQAIHDLRLALGRSPGVVKVSRVRRWDDVIPRYGVGHARRMEALRHSVQRALPGLVPCGNFMGGVSVDDRLTEGRKAAAEVLAAVQHRRAQPMPAKAAPTQPEEPAR